jgi:hypothetical protein
VEADGGPQRQRDAGMWNRVEDDGWRAQYAPADHRPDSHGERESEAEHAKQLAGLRRLWGKRGRGLHCATLRRLLRPV